MINVAELVSRKPGDNPHLWYDPATMPAFARALSAALVAADPAHRADYEQRLETVLASLKPIDAKVAELRRKHSGTAVTATEPVFGYMAAALGLVMRNERFQLAVMNDTEPSASDVAAFETDLRKHQVKLLIYNSQATDESARRLLEIAHRSKVPVIGVTETEPRGRTYQDWMQGQLDALDDALAKPGS
jgi:zinc/manganese transport system substrate-binding protein